VSFAPGHKWSRFARVSWDELHTRVRQELSKRLDAGLFNVGLQPGRVPLNQLASQGRFFFSPADRAKAEDAWTEMLEELKSLATRSERAVAKGSYH